MTIHTDNFAIRNKTLRGVTYRRGDAAGVFNTWGAPLVPVTIVGFAVTAILVERPSAPGVLHAVSYDRIRSLDGGRSAAGH